MLDRAHQLHAQLIAWRRHLHENPELGFQEIATAQYIADTLRPIAANLTMGVGKTGVVAEIGNGDGPIVAIRADMDALPITEESGAAYCSRVPGRMHACGHDAHVAIALGVAHLLHNVDMPGRVRLLFQPCEETADDEGKSGADRMLADGALAGVGAVLGLHVDPNIRAGRVAVGSGPIAAAPDAFWATIIGQGTHAAYPHHGLDPIWLAAQVINAIYGLRSRLIDPTLPAILTVGTINGGTADNIIPPDVRISGTIRTFDAETRAALHQGLHAACSIARNYGGDYELKIGAGCPPVINEPRITALVEAAAIDTVGAEQVEKQSPQCGADDFSVFSEQVPGCYFLLGTGGDGSLYECHDPRFNIDEAALPLGAAVLAQSALRALAALR